jgi:magnesium-transporting ATPase (P-type)
MQHYRGYWTLCPGEAILRFHTSLCDGLSASVLTCASSCSEAEMEDHLDLATLPQLSLRIVGAAVALRWVRPAVLLMALPTGGKNPGKPQLAMAAACMAASVVIDRFMSAFHDLQQHVLLSKQHAASDATIVAIRDGRQRLMRCANLVPGDIVFIGGMQGSYVPVDCRILASRGLRVDDSFLPHRRQWLEPSAMAVICSFLAVCAGYQSALRVRGRAVTAEADEEGIPVLRSRCVALATSTVAAGTATALVTRTGSSTVVCNLLSYLASFSLADVLLSPWLI